MIIHSAQNLSAFLTSVVIASLWIALLTAAAIQFFMPYITKWYQWQALSAWSRRTNLLIRRYGGIGKPTWSGVLSWLLELVPAKGELRLDILRSLTEVLDHGFERLGAPDSKPSSVLRGGKANPWSALRKAGLTDDQFINRVRAEARASLSRPSHNVLLFLLSTAGMKFEQEVAPLIAMEMIVESHPDVAKKIGEAASSRPEDLSRRSNQLAIAALRIANLDDIATQTAERNLTSLQNLLASARAWWIRFISLCFAGLLTFVAVAALNEKFNFAYLGVGLAGGLIATMLRDALTALTQRLAR